MHGFGDIDLDVLRGWREQIDPGLRNEHVLPSLARLVRLDPPDADSDQIETIHGPDVLVGRYNPQYGPVDIILGGLKDHENYRLGAPHLHLTLREGAKWGVRSVSPASQTFIGGVELPHGAERTNVEDGAELRLGHICYRFERCGVTLAAWKEARARLLDEVDEPSLFLCRRGGPCGPRAQLDGTGELVVGRSFPDRATLAGEHSWDGRRHPDWDLAGLNEAERKFIAFEHAYLLRTEGAWQLMPVASRRKTFVNRLEIIGQTPLAGGDEVGLGSVLFYLHEPGEDSLERRKELEPPAVIDWQEDSAPIADETSEAGS